MSTPHSKTLLRRTFAVLAAVAASSAAFDATGAAPLKRNDGTLVCNYTDLSIKPDGSITVACDTGTSTPPPTDPTPPPTGPTPPPTGPTQPPTGCPVPPAGMLTATLGGPGSLLHQNQASGQIVAIPLPKNAYNSIKVAVAENSTSPYPLTRLEMSINKCPGLIETDYANACNKTNTNGHYNDKTAITKPYSVITNQQMANQYGVCWAADGGDYYVNLRWTYDACRNGGICGFDIQHQRGIW